MIAHKHGCLFLFRFSSALKICDSALLLKGVCTCTIRETQTWSCFLFLQMAVHGLIRETVFSVHMLFSSVFAYIVLVVSTRHSGIRSKQKQVASHKHTDARRKAVRRTGSSEIHILKVACTRRTDTQAKDRRPACVVDHQRRSDNNPSWDTAGDHECHDTTR